MELHAVVESGQILAGKYRVDRVLGQGGMGMVVAAHHLQLGELVALKFLLPGALSDEEALARFLREAQAAAKIRSEHVARVTDVGKLENGAPYMVMEYLGGRDLSAVIASGTVPIENAVDYVAQTCQAIAEAHAIGIIHRDLKPANLMLVTQSDGSECVKVLDFGISKITKNDPNEASMTRTAVAFGSPLYMSPEQMYSARDVDGRTDIWALGTILYELLSGRAPFEAETLPALSIKVATEEPVPIRTLRPEVPEALWAVILRCLAKRREHRFPNVGELALALAPFAPERALANIRRAAAILRVGPKPGASSDRSVDTTAIATGPFASAPLLGAPAHHEADRQPTAPSWTRTATNRSLSRPVLSFVVVIGAFLFVVAAFLALRSREGSKATAASESASAKPPEPSESAAIAPAVKPAAPVPAAAPQVSTEGPEVTIAAPDVSAQETAAPPAASTKTPVATPAHAVRRKATARTHAESAHTENPPTEQKPPNSGRGSLYDDM